MAIPSNYNLNRVTDYPELQTLETQKRPISKLVYPSNLNSADAYPLTYIRFEVVDYSSESLGTSRDAFDRITNSTQKFIEANTSNAGLAVLAGSGLAGGFVGLGVGSLIQDFVKSGDGESILTAVPKDIKDITLNTKLKERKTGEPEAIIWLPEPDKLPYEYNAKYQDIDLTATQRAVDVINSAQNRFKDGVLSNTLKEAGISTIDEIIKRAGGNILETALGGGKLEFEKYVRAQTRMLPNPTQEFLFEGVTRRGFNFQFRLYAKSKEETQTIFEILRTFKANMLPSRAKNAIDSFYLKFPKLFRIQHRFIDKNGNDLENKYLPQMKLCSLESLSVDYTDSGRFSVFDEEILLNLFGVGKAPVGISLSLTFKETELLTSEDMKDDKAH